MSSPAITKIIAGGDPTPSGGVFAKDGTPALGLGQSSLNSANGTVFYAHVVDQVGGQQNPTPPAPPATTPPPLRMGIFRIVNRQVSKIVATGDPAPGGGKLVALFPPASNVGGDVAFGAIIQKEDNSLEEGAFLAAQGSLTAVVAARKLEGNTGASVLLPTLSDGGEIIAKVPQQADPTWADIVRSTKTNNSKAVGADTRSPAGQRLAPATADNSPRALSGDGDLTFRSDEGIFRVSRAGVLSKIVGYGDGTTNGNTIKAFDVPHTNTNGDVALMATLDLDPSNNDQPLQSIVLVSQGKLTPLASSGQVTPLGDAFVYVGSPVVNDRGEIAFGATTNSPPRVKGLFPVTAGIFVYSRGQIIKVAASGDPTPIGGVFLSSFDSPVLDNMGTVRFHAIIDLNGDGNPDNQGLFAAQIGGV